MFVVQNNRREIYNYNFFNNKELPKGNKSERLVYLISRLFCNPKGNSAYKLIFDMQNENNFVTKDAVCIQVTPAQQQLLKLVSHLEAVDHYQSLKNVHYVATYCADQDLLQLWQNGYVHQLLDAIQAIHQEHLINQLKTA